MVVSVEAENLLSFEKLYVDFMSGVTLLEGFNHDDQIEEGAGKSAIPNIISWVLFQEIPKDVKVDDVIRHGAKGGWGQTILGNGYGVYRSRKPNDVYMFKVDAPTEKIKGKDAKETQQMIEEMLGMSFKTFCQAVYFAQNYPNKFVTATEEDKAKILSEIEDLSQFDRARKAIVQRIKDLESESILVNKDVEHFTSALESLNSQKMGLVQLKGRFEVEKKEKWEARVAALFELDSSYEVKKIAYEELLANKPALEERLTALQATQESVNEAQSVIKVELGRIETETKSLDRLKALQKDYERTELNIVKEIATLEKEQIKTSKDFFDDIESLKKVKIQSVEYRDRDLRMLDNEKAQVSNPQSGELCPTCGSDLSKADPLAIQKHISDIDKKIDFTRKDVERFLLQTDSDIEKRIKWEAESVEKTNTKIMFKRTELVEIKLKRSELEQDLTKIQYPTEKMTELKSDLEALVGTKKQLDSDRRNAQMDLDKIGAIQVELSFLKEKVDRASSLLREVEGENSHGFDIQIQKIDSELNQKVEELQYAQSKKTVLNSSVARHETLKDGFKEVKSFAFRNTLLELNYKANDYLTRLFNQDVQIRFYNESEDGEVSKILCAVTIDGDKRALGLYSGGQSRRIQFAVDLALSDLISSRNKNTINFRILDEYFKDLCETSMENSLHLLQSLKGTTLLVEHNSMFKSIVNQVIRVELKNKVSEVIESNHGAETLDLQNLSGSN